MPLIVVVAILVFFAFKLGLFNDVDYASTPYDRMTCEDIADAIIGDGVDTIIGSKYVITGASKIERISKDSEKMICKATIHTDANEDFIVYLTGRAKSSDIKVSTILE